MRSRWRRVLGSRRGAPAGAEAGTRPQWPAGSADGTTDARPASSRCSCSTQLDVQGEEDPSRIFDEFWRRHPGGPGGARVRGWRSCAAPRCTRPRFDELIWSLRGELGARAGWRSSTATSSARASSSFCGEPASPRMVAINEALEVAKKFQHPRIEPLHSTGSRSHPQRAGGPLPEPRPPIRLRPSSPTVHANLEALTAVLADACLRGRASGALCLGDLVGYGADPVACVERVGERGQRDGGRQPRAPPHSPAGTSSGFNPWARAAARWTAEQLDQGHRDYLSALSLVRTVEDATLVHASHPQSRGVGPTWSPPRTACRSSADFATRLCFVGHSHLHRGVVGGQRWPGPRGPARRSRGEGSARRRPALRGQPSASVGLACAIAIRAPATRSGTAPRARDESDESRTITRRRRGRSSAAGLPRALADRLASGA